MLGIIGGSGFEKFDEFEVVELLNRETPFGLASSGFKKISVNGKKALFISRHGQSHEHLPSEINYRANIYAMKKQGVTTIVSFSAIGSLQQQYKPGDLVVPFQYIDRTKSLRSHTFCGEGVVGHVSLAHPVSEKKAEIVKAIVENADFDSHFGQTYVCIEGPYFSTKAESYSYRAMNADVIGMTNFPEYALAREAGISYVPCCFVTDYDCWDDSIAHVTVAEVLEVMRKNNSKAFFVLKHLMGNQQFVEKCEDNDQGLKTGLFMPPELIPENKKEIVKVLTN
ncbi:MAG: MTAP family purine nucleoside phosphorylase [Bdellovibrionales bacterium]|nr:MTAP family purine nucleoside phosphorylase [Bdellovibrionales bacterium]